MCLVLRKATVEDAGFVYRLRFRSDVVDVSFSSGIPCFSNHLVFFMKHLDEYSIIGDNVGFVRIVDGMVSIVLDEGFMGMGIGSRVLSGLSGRALVKYGNVRSFRCFLNGGFVPVGWVLEKL